MSDGILQKQKPSKEFLLSQIQTCEQTIAKNHGVIEFCKWFLENGDFEETQNKVETVN